MSINDKMVSEEVLEEVAGVDDVDLVRAFGVAPELARIRELRFALALEHFVERLPSSERADLRVFYSRVYWFNRFMAEYTREAGPDAGLEQQAFAILEQAPADVDWDFVEDVVNAAKQFGRAPGQ